eukprot:CAMPEP_0114535110 /NCGR_PEP_ID=MMETSP0109-20121206/28234_1 /TAXON_ID=29199 /ORGANISM="Chlorarachnion reptans, Strain CCCM449" /LENGTH=105 /DNA_ID=CAMNT_0001718639 /DNA_START=81 /DNA_END=398 /DNA_ORIENTATION=+
MAVPRRTLVTRSVLRGGAPKPEASGIIGKITSKDEYMVLATFGGVASIILLNKMLKGKPKPAPEKPAAAPSTSSDDGIPSFTDPAFAEWIGKEGNFEKLFAQLDD